MGACGARQGMPHTLEETKDAQKWGDLTLLLRLRDEECTASMHDQMHVIAPHAGFKRFQHDASVPALKAACPRARCSTAQENQQR
jgi:hypothetical protein